LLSPTGEIIDDVELIERNDKIEVELVKAPSDPYEDPNGYYFDGH
jgi:hypothetical protein